MNSSQDTEITLGTAKLLGLFFGLVMVCAVFFALGYTLGRKSDTGLAASNPSAPLQTATSRAKPAGSPMTFYKAVEQKDANPQLTPANEAVSSSPVTTPPATAPSSAASTDASSAAAQSQPSQTVSAPDTMAALSTSGYFVQVAAVSKQDDAEALVDALKKKQYPAFVASNSSIDKLFRVQLGPFPDIKEAEGMRSRLINDGYNPILKK